MPNGSLVIYDVTTEDSGKYTCIAGNSCNIKHREAFLYVVGEGGARCRDVASCHSGPHCWGFSSSLSTFLRRVWEIPLCPHGFGALCPTDKPAAEEDEGPSSHTPYKMIQTIGLSVGAAVAYIIIVLGLMFYCKKRRKAKRLKKHPEGEEPEMECLNGEANILGGGGFPGSPIALRWRG